jgi:hypothetical protein
MKKMNKTKILKTLFFERKKSFWQFFNFPKMALLTMHEI